MLNIHFLIASLACEVEGKGEREKRNAKVEEDEWNRNHDSQFIVLPNEWRNEEWSSSMMWMCTAVEKWTGNLITRMDRSLECLHDEEKREENQIRCLHEMINLRSFFFAIMIRTVNLGRNGCGTHGAVTLFRKQLEDSFIFRYMDDERRSKKRKKIHSSDFFGLLR